MEFEWDPAKSRATRLARGFGFDFAIQIFAGPTAECIDTRHSYGESRMVAIGAVGGDIFVVVYTDRSGIRRIISARPANRKERKRWRASE